MKNKKIIAFTLLILGIIILFLGIKNLYIDKDTKNPNIKDEVNNEKLNNDNEEIKILDKYLISNFEVSKNNDNKFYITFRIENNSQEDILNKPLYIHFYDNNSNILYSYYYLIEDLKVGKAIYINSTCNLIYQEISKYEFEIDSEKGLVKPTIVN